MDVLEKARAAAVAVRLPFPAYAALRGHGPPLPCAGLGSTLATAALQHTLPFPALHHALDDVAVPANLLCSLRTCI